METFSDPALPPVPLLAMPTPWTMGVLKTRCTFFSTSSRFLLGVGLWSACLPDRLFPWVTLGRMLPTPGPVPCVYYGRLLSRNDSLQMQNAPSLTSQFWPHRLPGALCPASSDALLLHLTAASVALLVSTPLPVCLALSAYMGVWWVCPLCGATSMCMLCRCDPVSVNLHVHVVVSLTAGRDRSQSLSCRRLY